MSIDESLSKRSKPAYKFRELTSYVSKYSTFTTNEYVTKFVIDDLGDDPMDNFGLILRAIIDRAFDHAQEQYKSEPYFYIVLISGEGLDYPVRVKATKHEDAEDNDIYMVIKKFLQIILNFFKDPWRNLQIGPEC